MTGAHRAGAAKRYQSAVRGVINLDEMAEADLALLDCASECDRLEAELAASASFLAEKFARFATGMGAGYMTSPPTGYSCLRDLDGNFGAFKTHVESLVTLARVTGGAARVTALKAALEASQ